MRSVFGLAGMATAGLMLQSGPAQAPENPLVVSLCELKAHPETFMRKLVEVTATASHGFEESMIEDSRGPGVGWNTAGRDQPTPFYQIEREPLLSTG
jgi:hypothetical protein